jgi:hypothetical protein
MSNHSGSYMLNGFLHGLVEIGILRDMSSSQKKSICGLLRSAVFEYDCNWPEILDVEISILLAACSCCGCESTEINTDNGYCPRCDQESQQARIRGGERDLLYRLLEHRFGSLPRWVSHRMQSAPEEDLLHWGERLLDDPLSLEEIFSSSDRPEG